jgi:hypothetical protein
MIISMSARATTATGSYVTNSNGVSGSATKLTIIRLDNIFGSSGGYTLPTASDTVKGGVKIGSGLTMTGEVLSATGGSGSASWGGITGELNDQSDLKDALAGKQETLVSGTSNESIRLAKKSSNIVATFAESFLEDPKRFTDHGFAKIFVPLSILVRDTDEEAEEEVSLIPKEKRVINGDSLYGSRETVKKKILELESFGVTDILFSHFDPQHDPQPVHEFLNQLTKDGILS